MTWHNTCNMTAPEHCALQLNARRRRGYRFCYPNVFCARTCYLCLGQDAKPLVLGCNHFRLTAKDFSGQRVTKACRFDRNAFDSNQLALQLGPFSCRVR